VISGWRKERVVHAEADGFLIRRVESLQELAPPPE
jgi:hypothetical protein